MSFMAWLGWLAKVLKLWVTKAVLDPPSSHRMIAMLVYISLIMCVNKFYNQY